MCPTAAQRFHAGVNDVSGRIEVGLADFQVNNIFAFGFQRPRPDQHLEGGLRPQPGHAPGQPQLSLRGFAHRQTSIVSQGLGRKPERGRRNSMRYC